MWFLTGHTVTEVFYDGAYHHYDSDMLGYNPVGKGDPRRLPVASVRQIEKDGGIILGKSAVNLSQVTPIARLTSEYNVFVLPGNSPLKTMKDVIEQLKKDPGSVKWGGGSRGSTEHIAAAMIARDVGVDPSKINYVAFRGGGEATAAILGGNVTVIGIDGKFDDWKNVGPEFRDTLGDPVRRNFAGWKGVGPYVNATGRSDIVAAGAGQGPAQHAVAGIQMDTFD